MTFKAGYTTGPWEFDGRCQIVEAARPHMRVAFLPSDHAEYASSEANARLIAAAPELLEELKGLVRFADAVRVQVGMGKTQIECLEKARTVIAKAEGGAA